MTDDAVLALIESVRPVVRSIARRYSPDPDTWDDMLQDHAMRLWKARHRLRDDQNPRAYAISAMHFVGRRLQQAHSRLKAKGVTLIHSLDDYCDHLEATTELANEARLVDNPLAQGDERGAIDTIAVREALNTLNADDAALVWLVLAEGWSFQQASLITGIPYIQALARYKSAVSQLKRQLGG